jgi:hypothetical protein
MDRLDLISRELSPKMTAAYNFGLSSAGNAPRLQSANLSGRFLVGEKTFPLPEFLCHKFTF